MATAVQSYSSLLRKQIEQTLAARGNGSLALAPRLVRPGFQTGYETLDAVLQGGLPVAGTSEIVGSRSSGRATLAAAYLAERTREGHVCAWIDVQGDMSPEAAMADGMDLDRVLWVRCAAASQPDHEQQPLTPVEPSLRQFRRDKSIGTPGVPNRPLAKPVPETRGVQVASDRQPKRRGSLLLKPQEPAKPVLVPVPTAPRRQVSFDDLPRLQAPFTKAKRPWGRLEQAIKSVDLLVQAGGFGAIVLDLGSIRAEFARRIPLATWFRWRAALERTRTSLVVLSEMGCAGSSAELMLRVEAELPPHGTVLHGLTYRLEVGRRRFAEDTPPAKKLSGRATSWESLPRWIAS